MPSDNLFLLAKMKMTAATFTYGDDILCVGAAIIPSTAAYRHVGILRCGVYSCRSVLIRRILHVPHLQCAEPQIIADADICPHIRVRQV